MEVIKTMKKHEWYFVEIERRSYFNREQWRRLVEPVKTMKEVRKVVKYIKQLSDEVRNLRVFKVAPYEEIDITSMNR